MKLSTATVERTLDQFEARALPENHTAIATLSKVFGERASFIDGRACCGPCSLTSRDFAPLKSDN